MKLRREFLFDTPVGAVAFLPSAVEPDHGGSDRTDRRKRTRRDTFPAGAPAIPGFIRRAVL